MLVGTFIKGAFNCQAVDVLYIYPIISRALQLALVFLIIDRMTKDRPGAVIGATLFILFDWTPYFMFLPPSMGFMLFMASMLTICSFHQDRANKSAWTLMLILFVTSCIISHLLSAVLVLGIMLALYVVENFPLKLFRANSRDTMTFGVLTLATVIMSSYTVYANSYFFRQALPNYLQSVGDLFNVFQTAGNAGSGSSAYSEVVLYKYLFTFIIGIALLVAFVYLLRKRRNIKDFPNFFPFLVMVVGAVVPIVFFSLYDFEAITRSFAYVIPFVALFLVYSWRRKAITVILVALMLISPVLFVASAYGNMNKDFVSRDEIIGTTFYYDHTGEQKCLVYGFNERLLLMDKINEWRYRTIDINNGMGNWENASYPSYVVVSDRAIEAGYYFGLGADIEGTYDILYGNPGARVYDSPSYKIFWTGAWNATVIDEGTL
jgi:hypothetical protein